MVTGIQYMIMEIIRIKNDMGKVLQRLGIKFFSGDSDYDKCSLYGLGAIGFNGYSGYTC